MKKFLLGVAVAVAVLLLIKYFSDKKESQERLEADTALIQTQIANVSKLVVTEGHFAEVLSYTDTQKYFMDLLSFDKKILTVVNADVTVAYDLHKIDYEVNEEQKKVIIKSLPEAEVKIYPTMKYYDVSQSQVNPFTPADVEKIQKKVKAELQRKVDASTLKSNAQNRLLTELSNLIFATRAVGWTLEYQNTPIENKDDFKFLWVVDFPMFDYDEEEQRYKAEHHPFTSIKAEDLDKFLAGQTEDIRTNTYDLVLNGSEIGGGSIRIFNPKIQSMVFDRLGLSQEEAKAKFGFFLDAFKYGAPPHGGLAFGIDRWLMVMLKEESIRDVIPFPKTNKGQCLMTEAPNTVDEKQLEELFIKSTYEK